MQTIVESLEIIRGAQRYGDMVPAEPVDGLKAPLDRRVGCVRSMVRKYSLNWRQSLWLSAGHQA
jgi:hypothetical protein